jgi:TolB-like protein/tetratricopeptide (TPR) repeat protein
MAMRPGVRVGPYEIAHLVGAGGMGEVYRARDTRLGREVAIKVLPAEFAADPERLHRFEQEAQAVAALDHPNILAIHDVGMHERSPYIVTELLEGESLRDRLKAGSLPAGRAVEIAVQMAQALAAAHEKGIVHRDVKPANVFLTRDCRVKLLDFGIAKLVVPRSPAGSAPATTVVDETAAGTTLGTMGYMSPEQLRGEPVDHRSDIFSLGCVLYEMLSGQSPFRRETGPDTVSAILCQDPHPLPGPERGISTALQGIVGQCLGKRPEDRYSTAHDVALALRALSGTVEVSPSRPGLARRRRHWLVLGGAAAALIVAVFAGWQLLRHSAGPGPQSGAEKQVRLAVLPFENLGHADDTYFATGVTDEITGRLAGVRGLAVLSRWSALQYARTTKSAKQVGQELGVSYLVTGTVRWSRGAGPGGQVRITPQLVRVADDTSVWAHVYDFTMDDIFRVQSEMARSVVESLGFTLLEHERGALEARPTQNLDAYQAFLRGKFLAGQPHFTLASWLVALDAFKQATALDPGFALAWAELSQAHARLVYYRYDISPQRREWARHALERAAALAPASPATRLASGYYHLWVERDPAAALVEFEAASAGLPGNADVLQAEGELFRLRGDWKKALETFRAASSLSPRDASLAVDVAETCWWMRRYREAAAASDHAIALGPEQAWAYLAKIYNLFSWKGRTGLAEARTTAALVPKEHEFRAWTWYWLEAFDERYTEALKVLDTSEGDWIRIKVEAAPKPYFAALAYSWLGDSRRAHEEMENASRLLEAEVRKVPEDGLYHSSLGVAYALLGRREEALREGKRGVELLPLSKDPVYGIPHVIALARIYTLLGDEKEALAQIEVLLSHPGWVSVQWLEMDPCFRSLRDKPRFRALCAKYQVTV